MRKIYVLDTSVLVHDPHSFKTFFDSEVVLPITVLDELDKLKKFPNEAGRNARMANRLIYEISNLGDISTGILLDNNVFFKIDVGVYNSDHGDALYGDTRIVACAKAINEQNPDARTTLLSNDISLCIRAKSLGIFAEFYNENKASASELFDGIKVIDNIDAAANLLNAGKISPDEYGINLLPQEFATFIDDEGVEVACGRKVSEHCIKLVRKIYPWGISPRNKEQILAIDLISDPNLSLVTLVGSAGTGKSLVALAASLEMVLNKKVYDKLVIYRPIQPVGQDIGYIPGTKEEKLAPWFQAIIDSFELLFQNSNGEKWRNTLDMYVKKERIQMEAMVYIRGRSISNAIMLIDEAQNISKEDMKTILTRAGENTKIILTGDISQIDNRDLDAMDNGLTYAIEKFKSSNIAGHITFIKGERSALATEASIIL